MAAYEPERGRRDAARRRPPETSWTPRPRRSARRAMPRRPSTNSVPKPASPRARSSTTFPPRPRSAWPPPIVWSEMSDAFFAAAPYHHLKDPLDRIAWLPGVPASRCSAVRSPSLPALPARWFRRPTRPTPTFAAPACPRLHRQPCRQSGVRHRRGDEALSDRGSVDRREPRPSLSGGAAGRVHPGQGQRRCGGRPEASVDHLRRYIELLFARNAPKGKSSHDG